jgi:hypothetical protein
MAFGLFSFLLNIFCFRLCCLPCIATETTMTMLTPLNRRSENIYIKAVITPELKFGDIERHVFLADFVERPHNAALHDRPETLNRVRVDSTDNILVRGMADDTVREIAAKITIAGMLVGADQADFFRNRFIHKTIKRFGIGAVDHAGDDTAFALHCADDGSFAGAKTTSPAPALIPMLVVPLAAEVAFVNLDNAAQFGLRFDQSRADFMAHGMRRAVAAEPHDALNLKGANSLLVGEHQMGDAKPLAERLVCVLKDGARNVREAITRVRSALIALPLVFHRSDGKDLGIAASRAANAFRPAPLYQIRLASIFIREHRLKLSDGHLVNWLRSAGQLTFPCYRGQYGMEI